MTGLTQVDVFTQRVVHDLKQAHYVGMTELLHDGNLLENLQLGATKFVDERHVR